MDTSNQIGNTNKQLVSASDCTCHVIPVAVPMMSSWGEPDVHIDEKKVECQACIDALFSDVPSNQHEWLSEGDAYRYLPKKYSIKCTYMQEEEDYDLPF